MEISKVGRSAVCDICTSLWLTQWWLSRGRQWTNNLAVSAAKITKMFSIQILFYTYLSLLDLVGSPFLGHKYDPLDTFCLLTYTSTTSFDIFSTDKQPLSTILYRNTISLDCFTIWKLLRLYWYYFLRHSFLLQICQLFRIKFKLLRHIYFNKTPCDNKS